MTPSASCWPGRRRRQADPARLRAGTDARSEATAFGPRHSHRRRSAALLNGTAATRSTGRHATRNERGPIFGLLTHPTVPPRSRVAIGERQSLGANFSRRS